MRLRLFVTLLAVLLVSCSRDDTPRAEKKPRQKTRVAGEQWIVVGVEKRISATESMRVLRIASSVAPQVRDLDRSCLLYRDEELKTSQIVCPNGVPDLSLYGD